MTGSLGVTIRKDFFNMKSLGKIALLLLVAMLLPILGACTQTPPDVPGPETEQTGPEGESNQTLEKPPREVYEDLSANIPAHADPGTKSATVKSEGKGASSSVKLDFSQSDGSYIISPTKVTFSCHDVTACDTCGYVDTELGGAYLMSAHGQDQGGIAVTLAAPVLASSVTGMTLTFKTTGDASASSMRILVKDQTNNAAFINTCGSMGGAVDKWGTVDLGVNDFTKLADSDGYIRSFQMYFRDKNKVDCYVQSVEFITSPEPFLAVEEVSGNCFYRKGAVEAIAKVIANRFTEADIAAEITVNAVKYVKNSSSSDGSMRYKATATLADGTTLSTLSTALIPAIEGVWLDASGGQYSATHDAKGQWQDTFDPSGILFLTDNTMTCAEGIRTVEYTIIPKDAAHDGEQVVWLAPQLLETKKSGFEYLLINAFLDFGNGLVEGESYRILVRGVTNRDNYILHVDVPFVYKPLSASAADALVAAQAALDKAEFTCSADVENKADYLQKQLNSLIGNEAITPEVDILGEGLGSMRVCVYLRYTPAITEARLPKYELDGKVISDVYNFAGQAFMKEAFTVKYSDETTVITLTSPYDGDRHVILAADVIYDHAKAPLNVIENASYGYIHGEYCTPAPVVLTWEDANAASGKSYTVLISTNRDMSGAKEITVVGRRTEIYNLNIGTTYYWQVKSGADASPVQVFTTEDGYPRFIKLDGVSNVRDIGGYVTADGRRVKQNLAYRAAHLDAITADAREYALKELGLRTDLDLRGGSSAPLGSSVQHVSVAMQWYDHIFEKDKYEDVRKAIATFADEKNYPIIFHCSMGRDRTGTTAYLILGLLGVDEDTLCHEYYASFFSQQGAFNEAEFELLVINLSRLRKGLDDFGDKDDTLQEKIHAYLLHIGVTEQEIRNIKDIWLE